MVHTSSAVVLGALALNAANALATPVMNPINSEFQARDDNTNQLEERRIGSFLTKAAPFIPLLSMIPGLGGQQRRELIEELEARGTTTDKLKKFAPWAPLIPFALDFLKPAQPQQQAPPPPPPQRREIEEFLGREISDVEARGLGKFFTKVAPVLPFISMIPGLGGQQRRDVDEGLEERGFRNTFSKIAPWAPLIPIGLDLLKGGQQQQAPPPPPPQRRDIEEMLGRDLSDVEARGLSEILDTVSQVAPYLPMIGGMLPEKKPTIAPKPAHLRGKPKREVSDDESIEARAFRSKFDKISPWGPVIAIGADLIKQKISPPPPPPTFDPATMGAPPTARDVDDNEELEARAVKGGRGGGFGGALKKVGSGLEKAAPWVPLVGLGADMLLNQNQGRDVEDDHEIEARAVKGGRGGGFGGALKKVGGGLEKAAPWVPLVGLGADMLLNQNQGRDVEDDQEIEARAVKGGRGGGFGGALKKVGGGLEKAAPWIPLVGLGADMLLNQNQGRDVEESELETRATKAGRPGGSGVTNTLKKVGSTVGKVAPWAPLIAMGADMLLNQQAREFDEDLEARDYEEDQAEIHARDLEELLGRELTDVEARGFRTGLSKVAPWAPLIATGLSFLPTGQQRRDVAEEIMDIFHRELSSLEDLD